MSRLLQKLKYVEKSKQLLSELSKRKSVGVCMKYGGLATMVEGRHEWSGEMG